MTTPAARSLTAATDYVCGWTVDSACCSSLATADLDVAQAAVDTAAEILYALSGRQFGLCTFVARPCRLSCCDPCDTSGPRWTPVLSGGEWTNVSCGSCGPTGCSCTRVEELALPGPVFDVTQVRVDGRVLDPSEYRVDNHRTLVRTGVGTVGGSRWVGTGSTFVLDGTQGAWPVTASGDTGLNADGQIVLRAGGNPSFVRFPLGTDRQRRIRVCLPAGTDLPLSDEMTVVDIPVAGTEGSTIFEGQADGVRALRGGVVGGCATLELGQDQGFLLNPVGGDVTVVEASYLTARNDPQRAAWPTCQAMELDADQPGTWEVTYRRGQPLPAAGRNALGVLACELVKACVGDPSCCLPARVTSITRQGISMAMLDPMTFISDGRTGLYAVDAWLQAVNPKQRVRRAGILSVDVPSARHTTWRG